jgi:hypothetical protein
VNAQVEKYYPIASIPRASPFDQLRCEHSELRYAMLRGTWVEYLEKAIRAHVPNVRRIAWGPQDMTSNVFRGVASEVGGAPYLVEPIVTGPSGSEALIGRSQDSILTAAGYWQLMQGACEDLVGLREVGMRLAYSADGGLVADPVPPHLLEVTAPSWAPMSPTKVSCLDLREHPQRAGAYLWTRETWDITDPMAPSYRITDATKAGAAADITELFARVDGQPASSATLSGEGYDWRWTQGEQKNRPFIPVSVYHAMRRASFFDAWYGVEAVAGSLTLAVLHTWWVHCIRDGAIATVLIIDGIPAGIQIEEPAKDGDSETPPVAWVAIEAGAFNLMSSIGDKQVQVHQLRPQADPLQLIQAIQAFEQRVALYAGVSASDLVRQSGDPRSGYALSVSSEGKRKASRRLEPQLRAGDLQVLSMAAALANRSSGLALPETGYAIRYCQVQDTPEEQKAMLDQVERELRLGLLTRSDAIQRLHPDWNAQQIAAYLLQVANDRAAIQPPIV